ncbi:MAG: hypothetical protein HFI87_03235 [Bacilli bacterium]|nr:hypothetical protein [Bacilli bacterium]
MGNIINMIVSNDSLFYGIIVFLIVGVILLFMYLHHKKFIKLLEEEVDFTKVDEETSSDNSEILAKVEEANASLKKIEEEEIAQKISNIDGKVAIEKILNEDKEISNNANGVIDKDKVKKTEAINKEVTKDEPKSELELMLEKMQQDLEEQKDKDAVAIFEQEQEEKSIISYKELLERKNDLTNSEILSDPRFENEPNVLENTNKNLTDNYVNLIDNVNNTISINSNKEENSNSSKKFVTTDFISPVFGRQTAEFDYPKVPNFKDMVVKSEKGNTYELEATLNLEPLTEQIKKDDAFLSALKEFRKNLE